MVQESKATAPGQSLEEQTEALDAQMKPLEDRKLTLQGELQSIASKLDALQAEKNKLLRQISANQAAQVAKDRAQAAIDRVSADIQKLRASQSGIGQGIATVMEALVVHSGAAAMLGNLRGKSLSHMYSGHERSRIELATGDPRTQCHIIPFDDNSYAVTYWPGDPKEEAALRSLLQNAPNSDPSRYNLDSRVFALHVDLTQENPSAIPVAIFSDNQEPATYGLIKWTPYSAPSDQLTPFVDRIKTHLSSSDIKVGEHLISRTPPVVPPKF